MASRLLTLATLTVAVLGIPTPSASDNPVRILPSWWSFNITTLSGPGCPGLPSADAGPYVARPTYGMNTVDGSEIYYWFFAYPGLHASVGPGTPKSATWCETTLSYTETDLNGIPVPKPEYRLKPHKNGTAINAVYNLDAGVEAEWKVTYYTDQKAEIVDTILVTGPRTTTYGEQDISSQKELVQWKLPDCGAGTIKFRTELTVTANTEGASGTVTSEATEYQGKSELYGVQQGVSYDWEYCNA